MIDRYSHPLVRLAVSAFLVLSAMLAHGAHRLDRRAVRCAPGADVYSRSVIPSTLRPAELPRRVGPVRPGTAVPQQHHRDGDVGGDRGRAQRARGLRLRAAPVPLVGGRVPADPARADDPARCPDHPAVRRDPEPRPVRHAMSACRLVYVAFGLPLSILVLRAFFAGIPRRAAGGGAHRRRQRALDPVGRRRAHGEGAHRDGRDPAVPVLPGTTTSSRSCCCATPAPNPAGRHRPVHRPVQHPARARRGGGADRRGARCSSCISCSTASSSRAWRRGP